jgi:hypothetical protein
MISGKYDHEIRIFAEFLQDFRKALHRVSYFYERKIISVVGANSLDLIDKTRYADFETIDLLDYVPIAKRLPGLLVEQIR